MFNSREYEWADVTVIVGGVDILGIRGVKWNRKAEREPVYAKGRDPHSIQTGNNSYEGELTMLQSSFDQIEQATGDILTANVDILVAFGNPLNGDMIRSHRVLGARFNEDALEIKQGDKFAEIKVPFMALKIQKFI